MLIEASNGLTDAFGESKSASYVSIEASTGLISASYRSLLAIGLDRGLE